MALRRRWISRALPGWRSITFPAGAASLVVFALDRLAATRQRGDWVLFGDLEEGLHLLEGVVGDVRGLNRHERLIAKGRMHRIDDECGADRCDRSQP